MNKSTWIALAGAVIVVIAIAMSAYLLREDTRTPDRAVPEATTQNKKTDTPAPSQPAITMPTFDVVRVNPEGDTVIAGRAQPNATIYILDGDDEIGHINADDRGEWVFVPDTPLSPGERKLGLKMRTQNGEEFISEHVVILLVPERNKDIAGRDSDNQSQALALMVPRTGSGPSFVLQKPSVGAVDPGLGVDSIDYGEIRDLNLSGVDENGTSSSVTISGHASPGSLVNVYLDNRFIGRTVADGNGLWQLTPTDPIRPGTYSLRIDQLDEDGAVTARTEFPFTRAAQAELDSGNVVVVQPGNSLWRLARQTYGSGFRFTTIFEANKDQIRDPDLIYPGQVFTLPPAE